MPAKDFIPIREALDRLDCGYSYRHVRRLIQQGKVKARQGGSAKDGRVKTLVSFKSLSEYASR